MYSFKIIFSAKLGDIQLQNIGKVVKLNVKTRFITRNLRFIINLSFSTEKHKVNAPVLKLDII